MQLYLKAKLKVIHGGVNVSDATVNLITPDGAIFALRRLLETILGSNSELEEYVESATQSIHAQVQKWWGEVDTLTVYKYTNNKDLTILLEAIPL